MRRQTSCVAKEQVAVHCAAERRRTCRRVKAADLSDLNSLQYVSLLLLMKLYRSRWRNESSVSCMSEVGKDACIT